jgi:FkbM family methyltransferase
MKNPAKMIGNAYYRARGYYPISISNFSFKVDPYHPRYWRSVARGEWEPQTYEMMNRLLKADSLYCDIGAWIGPTVIYAAKICREVIAFEPDPVAYRYLRWNIELNDLHNVVSFNVALSDEASIRRMGSFGGKLGDSTTTLLDNHAKGVAVDAVALPWHAFAARWDSPAIDYLKIDIEGGEFVLVPTLRDYLLAHKPIVHLSTHAPFLDIATRREKMQELMHVMSIYRNCFDQHLKPVDLCELEGEAALGTLTSFVFTD